MADFTLKRHKDFIFALEDDPGKSYSLPYMGGLGFDDAEKMRKIGEEKSIVKQGALIKEFILKYAPDLKDKGLSDMEYFSIYNAYGLSEGNSKLGES